MVGYLWLLLTGTSLCSFTGPAAGGAWLVICRTGKGATRRTRQCGFPLLLACAHTAYTGSEQAAGEDIAPEIDFLEVIPVMVTNTVIFPIDAYFHGGLFRAGIHNLAIRLLSVNITRARSFFRMPVSRESRCAPGDGGA